MRGRSVRQAVRCVQPVKVCRHTRVAQAAGMGVFNPFRCACRARRKEDIGAVVGAHALRSGGSRGRVKRLCPAWTRHDGLCANHCDQAEALDGIGDVAVGSGLRDERSAPCRTEDRVCACRGAARIQRHIGRTRLQDPVDRDGRSEGLVEPDPHAVAPLDAKFNQGRGERGCLVCECPIGQFGAVTAQRWLVWCGRGRSVKGEVNEITVVHGAPTPSLG